ncbi:hypothetical protein [Roseofilum capinflatum]|uniref:Uncharacterized protein n=1 Tax=Roseofilum capinflatum BLCC-M114 TaxID=3022440 RepID=A0ABT7B6A6_9CYAN|nr:hypothetical protein [Roseofilum capinflatum]MDJ1174700.1 hypothetical protein [Roseofilum capinflatum BLCC-M114]
MSSVTWNKNLNKILSKAFADTCKNQGQEYQRLFSDTEAFEGFSGQDIIDTGALKGSQSLAFPNRFQAQFSWGMEYATYVHEGYTLRSGGRQPGRPWTKPRKDFIFSDRFIDNLGGALV